MEQFTNPPQMSSPTMLPMPAPTATPMPVPPKLGPTLPGTTGGLPALSGLSVYQNPMAQQLQSMGRGDDKMLVHMTPGEVQSLRGLAQLTGGDLTRNPHTGLPEAGWLGRLLPSLFGLALNFVLPGSGLVASLGGKAITAGLITGLGTGIATGSLGKGLMGALGGFGGASLGGALQGALGSGAASQAAQAANAGATPALDIVGTPVINSSAVSAQAAGLNALGSGAATGANLGANIAGQTLAPAVTNTFAAPVAAATVPMKTGIAGFMQGFGNTAKGLDLAGTGSANILGKAAPLLAATGLATSSQPSPAKPGTDSNTKTEYGYTGPYHYDTVRKAVFPTAEEKASLGTAEWNYFPQQRQLVDGMGNPYTPGQKTTPFTTSNSTSTTSLGGLGGMMAKAAGLGSPVSGGMLPGETVEQYLARTRGQTMLAKGGRVRGKVDLKDGSFIVDARTVSELGNGSSNAGHEILARMGGEPIHGPGDGVSDSIKASIGGTQPARVARDEVKFGPEAITRLGGGSHSRGTKKLYALMDKAAKARAKAKRGQDTGLRRGLA